MGELLPLQFLVVEFFCLGGDISSAAKNRYGLRGDFEFKNGEGYEVLMNLIKKVQNKRKELQQQFALAREAGQKKDEQEKNPDNKEQ